MIIFDKYKKFTEESTYDGIEHRKSFIKRLFCNHDFATTIIPMKVNLISGEEYAIICKKCGCVKDMYFCRF